MSEAIHSTESVDPFATPKTSAICDPSVCIPHFQLIKNIGERQFLDELLHRFCWAEVKEGTVRQVPAYVVPTATHSLEPTTGFLLPLSPMSGGGQAGGTSMSITKGSSRMGGGGMEGGEPILGGGRRVIFSEAALLSDEDRLCRSRPPLEPDSSVVPRTPGNGRPSPTSDKDREREEASSGDKLSATPRTCSMSKESEGLFTRLLTSSCLAESCLPPPAMKTMSSFLTSLHAFSSESARLGAGGLSPLGGGEGGREESRGEEGREETISRISDLTHLMMLRGRFATCSIGRKASE